MIGTLSIILVLGGLIFFHELGHFIFAKLFGVGVKTFSLGFGPKIWGVNRNKTSYQISAVPLGGYVAMVGEEAPEDIPAPFTAGESFALRPAWQRLVIVAAGPIFNLLLAWLVYWFLFSAGAGVIDPVVSSVLPDSPAATSGLRAGDRILSLDGVKVRRWEEISLFVNGAAGKTITVEYERNGETRRTDVTPRKEVLQPENPGDKPVEVWRLGLSNSGEFRELGFVEACVEGFHETWNKAIYIGQSLGMLISGRAPIKDLGGPVLIGQMVYERAHNTGLLGVLPLTAFLSINLGLLNLLPIPVLDGGHILFFGLELLIRRPVSVKIREISTRLGLVFLLALMLFATGNDIMRIFNG